TLVDTGLETMTGGRLKRIKNYLVNETFCLTYGDDLKNVNISDLVDFHHKKKTLATVTAVQPAGRFGILKLDNDMVLSIKEKPAHEDQWINGGYYVLEPAVFDYIKDDSTVWEREPLEKLALENQLSAYKYTGFYQPLDTLQDKNKLEELWNSGKAHWKVWQ
ncbi:MAG: glucose-1-phosphate cytidylyltransferase, partial [Nitrosopumilales archaeon]